MAIYVSVSVSRPVLLKLGVLFFVFCFDFVVVRVVFFSGTGSYSCS